MHRGSDRANRTAVLSGGLGGLRVRLRTRRVGERLHVELHEPLVAAVDGVEVLPAPDLVDAGDAERGEGAVVAGAGAGVASHHASRVELSEDVFVCDEVAGEGRLEPAKPTQKGVLDEVDALLLDV